MQPANLLGHSERDAINFHLTRTEINKRADPQLVAELLVGVLKSTKPRLRCSFGTDAWAALVMRTMLPWDWFERALIKASRIEG